MDKKQILVVSLLIIAIVLSATSIFININLNRSISPFGENIAGPNGNIGVTVNEPLENVEVADETG